MPHPAMPWCVCSWFHSAQVPGAADEQQYCTQYGQEAASPLETRCFGTGGCGDVACWLLHVRCPVHPQGVTSQAGHPAACGCSRSPYLTFGVRHNWNQTGYQHQIPPRWPESTARLDTLKTPPDINPAHRHIPVVSGHGFQTPKTSLEEKRALSWQLRGGRLVSSEIPDTEPRSNWEHQGAPAIS